MSRHTRGFFSSINGALRDRHAGRFLSLQVREFARHDPAAFTAVFRSMAPDLLSARQWREFSEGLGQVETEWSHVGKKRADIALLLHGAPILLFEVKEADSSLAGNDAQLSDYLDFISKRGGATKLVHISRYTPKQSFRRLKDGIESGHVADFRYSDLLTALRECENASITNSPIARMIIEYLEDIGVASYQWIDFDKDATAITFLLAQLGSMKHTTGWGRAQTKDSASRSAELLGILLGNCAVLGDWFYEANVELLTRRPSTRFRSFPYYDRKAVQKALDSGSDDQVLIAGGASDAFVKFEARSTLQSSPYAYIGFGTTLAFDDEAGYVRAHPFAECYWHPNGYVERGWRFLR